METVRDFILGGSKITAEVTVAMKLKRLLLGRKAMSNLDSIVKSRDITLPTKVCLVKAMVFLVVMYGMWELDYKESWVLKNSCFWTAVLEKTLESPLDCKEIQPAHLRLPWTARRSNQSIIREINSEYSLEGLMLKLKLQYLLIINLFTDLKKSHFIFYSLLGALPCTKLCFWYTRYILATWYEELTHWKRPWCWEWLKVGGEGMIEDEMAG